MNEYQLNLFFKLGQNDDKITLAFYVSSFVLPKTRVKAAIPPPDLAELQVSAQGYLSGCASSLFIMEYCRLYYIFFYLFIYDF